MIEVRYTRVDGGLCTSCGEYAAELARVALPGSRQDFCGSCIHAMERAFGIGGWLTQWWKHLWWAPSLNVEFEALDDAVHCSVCAPAYASRPDPVPVPCVEYVRSYVPHIADGRGTLCRACVLLMVGMLRGYGPVTLHVHENRVVVSGLEKRD